ncbi:cytochrome c maturation protein CcmE [Paraferrimonas sp. SM1919]|uniref:cytochrome c maturation protein CcmE n=1 Tax=Paraferrimonas sp. SM1919 TaxID=2662263 RepID=UPI0013D55410|nr:cytochrome c maturation protein CcmE [Paraferrimonas sp. SM1919]
MNPRRKKRLAFASLLVLGVGAMVTSVIYALNSNMDLFFTPSEIVHGKEDSGEKPVIGQRIRIGGMVSNGSLVRDPNSLLVTFKVHDGTGTEITVTYDDLLPDLFREGQGIVAQGVLQENYTVEASEVLAKHDEEYMPPEVAEAMGKKHKKLDYSAEQE